MYKVKKTILFVIVVLVIALLALSTVDAHHRPGHCLRTPRNPHCVTPTPTLAVRARPTQPLASACYIRSPYCG